jgi:TPR repeat protein
MSLENVVPDASTERTDYHTLARWELQRRKEEPEALFQLGIRWRSGIDEEINEELGWQFIIQAAKLHHPIALAFCLAYGKEITQDKARSFQLHHESAMRGHPAGSCKHAALTGISGQNATGYCYEQGLGVARDTSQAFYWFSKAAEQNHFGATRNLALCFKKGLGVHADKKLAFEMLVSCASRGDPAACVNLGYCYKNGEGVEQNFQESIRMFRCASHKRDAYGLNSMGHCYAYARGVKKNKLMAAVFYRMGMIYNHDAARTSFHALNLDEVRFAVFDLH